MSGLKPNTTYHYWIVAKNGGGTVHGTEAEFKTPPAPVEPPGEVVTGAAEGVTATGAVLTGRLNPHGGASYYFEYGEASCGAEACGTKTAEAGPLTGATQEPGRLQP